MKAIIYFLYADGRFDSRETTKNKAAEDIRYWLGKSPGTHDLADILVVPEGGRDWMEIARKRSQELETEEEERALAAERAEFERLKLKFQG